MPPGSVLDGNVRIYGLVLEEGSQGTKSVADDQGIPMALEEIENFIHSIIEDLIREADKINDDPTIRHRSLRATIRDFQVICKIFVDEFVLKKYNKQGSNDISAILATMGEQLDRYYVSIKARSSRTKFDNDNAEKVAALLKGMNIASSLILEYRNKYSAYHDTSKIMSQPFIPTELPAPIRIAVSEDRISLTAPKHKSGQLAERSIENLRRSACDILEELIEELSRPISNADRRLSPRLKSLHRELNVALPDMAVEAVGLQWQVTSDVIAATRETVPDALLPQIQRILTTIRNLLAQFDEWQEYEAFTFSATIHPEDARELAKIGDEIAAEISGNDEAIDHQISDRLHDMTVALSTGLVRQETLTAPIVGSLSNLFAGISQFVLERGAFILNTAAEVGMTVTEPTTLGRGVILLSICTFLLNKFAPKLMNYSPFSWLKSIQPTSVKYFSALSKTGKG